MADKKNDEEKAPIIIVKRIKKVEGHHGGAWKIALADFMTAMFCFFLVMWLVGITSDEQKAGIAQYFNNPLRSPFITTSDSPTGAGGLLSGASLLDTKAPLNEFAQTPAKKSSESGEKSRDDIINEELDKEDSGAFSSASESIREGLQGLAGTGLSEGDLKRISDNVLIDVTHEGLRIQIVDADNREMFKSASAEAMPHALEVVKIISDVIKDLPNQISIRGHTDSMPLNAKGGEYTNWELSSDRAQTVRRIMINSGVNAERIVNIQGRADREHLDVANPNSPRNRRVSLILMHQSAIRSEKTQEENFNRRRRNIQKREEGVIYFP